MGRIASPNATVGKFKNMGSTGPMSMGSTMAGTAGNSALQTMNTQQMKLRGSVRHASGMSSPFKDSVVRGMVKGVGLLQIQ